MLRKLVKETKGLLMVICQFYPFIDWLSLTHLFIQIYIKCLLWVKSHLGIGVITVNKNHMVPGPVELIYLLLTFLHPFRGSLRF